MNMEYTFAIVGDDNTGKNTLAKRYTTGLFIKSYHHSSDMQYYSCSVNTNHGIVHLKIIVAPSDRKEEIIQDADGILFCYDSLRPETLDIQWINNTLNGGSKPVSICGTKCKSLENNFGMIENEDDGHFLIDSKWNYNLENPFLHLLKKIKGEDLAIIDSEAVVPPMAHL
jgi:hypothetical protein